MIPPELENRLGRIETSCRESGEGISYIKGRLDEWDKKFMYRVDALEEDLDGVHKEVEERKKFCLGIQIIKAAHEAASSTKQKVIYGALVTLVAMFASLLVKHFL